MESKYPSDLDELVREMEQNPDQYQHLKIFLRRGSSSSVPNFGEEFLAVSKSGFGLNRVESLDYQNGTIILSLTETSTGTSVKYSVDIYNEKPDCLFLRWKDVKSMVFDEYMKSDLNDSQLLEFCE